MKKISILLSLLVMSLCLIFPLPLEAKTSPWARASIVRLELLDILEDDMDFEAKYQVKLVREEFCELLVKFYLYVEGGTIENYGRISPFEDTNNRYVIAANKLGFVKGLSETKFGPREEITREQVATMMKRALTQMKLGSEAGNYKNFVDDAEISPWAKEAVYFCRANSVMEGVKDGKFAPKSKATKEELIKLLDNTLLNFKKDGIRHSVFDKSFYNYKIPTNSLNGLDYGLTNREPKALRITLEDGAMNKDFDVLSAAYEIYELTSPVIGHEKARTIARLVKNEWSESSLSFSKNRDYGINSKNQVDLLKDGVEPDVVLSFNGSFVIDIIK